MNDQERQVISDIFRRLEQVADQPRDPEAERFIAEKLRQQPYAPYALAQAVFVQEQALANLQAENEHLRGELDRASRQPQTGGFLSSIFGGGHASRPPGPAYNTPPARQASPWGQPQAHPQQHHGAPQGGMMGGAPGPWGGGMMQRGGGGSFLGTALSTAAGVAGGVMIANALTNAFSGDNNPLSDVASAAGLGGADKAADAGAADASNAGITDSLYQDANQQENQGDFSDFGGDGGDEGDWA
ncbi:DUF2076 domain-containing protein [Microvirga sp. CF3016]|uniref:DUF2076 domain-containing protein n=1 Tax=Microvirga sp. CF3016 TaxID=3110181 RepID=UPI002E786D23|nr:DUF2076 domain-containing protein [Microvirga sp. CF3016]MEE1610478.1 DUF2076 domain-containing protein [Microvirga sp. CF3016]